MTDTDQLDITIFTVPILNCISELLSFEILLFGFIRLVMTKCRWVYVLFAIELDAYVPTWKVEIERQWAICNWVPAFSMEVPLFYKWDIVLGQKRSNR
jgi:hypothetical protein